MLENLLPNILLFVCSTVVIILAGTRLVKLCDELADSSGFGEAIIGAIFLGGLTSLPGITASVTAAWDGAASLALSNAYGGIAVQTLFIAFADIAYRKANLEHAAASLENLMSGVGLLILLAMLFYAHSVPTLAIGHVHPISLLLPCTYAGLVYASYRSRRSPMWFARQTPDTRKDVPDRENENLSRREILRKILKLALVGLLIVGSGWLLTKTGINITEIGGLDQSIMGAFLIAIITSLPELVTSVAAVRRGALTLAIGGILGGNAFDTMFAAIADYAYLEGSIYQYVALKDEGVAAMAAIMTGFILIGLLHRQQKGPGGIGFESVAVILVYCIGSLILVLS